MSGFGQCPICQELFTSPSEISVVQCGHTFHQHCILQWLERQGRAATCPQCRKPISEKALVRQLFFDQSGDQEEDHNHQGNNNTSAAHVLSDAVLKNKVSELEGAMGAKDAEVSSLKKAITAKEKEAKDTLSELKHLRKRVSEHEGSINAMRIQLGFMESIKEDKRRLEDKLKKSQKQLKSCDVYNKLFNGTTTEAKEAVSKQDAESLPQMLDILKAQYDKVRKDKEHLVATNSTLSATKRKLETDYAASQKLVESLREEIKVRGKNSSPFDPSLKFLLENSCVESPLTQAPKKKSHSQETPSTSRIVSAIPNRAKNPPPAVTCTIKNDQDQDSSKTPSSPLKYIDIDPDSPNVLLPGGMSSRMVLASKGLHTN